MKHIYFIVTNDLSYDQRMHRICNSLATNGYKVTLLGRKLYNSLPLQPKSFGQHRLKCFFNTGFLFYTEYNFRVFFYLLFKKVNGICAIDLDTILPCLCISKIKGIVRIYDAHEYFTELKEVRTRPFIKSFWSFVEKISIPQFKYCYTVSTGLANEFKKAYHKDFIVIRNIPVLQRLIKHPGEQRFLLYQGAVNEARGFEYLIPAMNKIDTKLVICGDGNFMEKLVQLIRKYNVGNKVELRGMLLPEDLLKITAEATLGINLVEKEGINQYYSLANKFFDYMHAGIPQLCVDYPAYREINDKYQVAVLIGDLSPESIAATINATINNKELLQQMHQACLAAREEYNWQAEEKKLINFYNQIFKS